MKNTLILTRNAAMQYWQARNRREQTLLMVGGAVVLLGLYAFSLQAVLGQIERLNKRLPQLTLNSYEIAAGSRTSAAPVIKRSEDLRSELFRVLADQGVQAELRGLSSERVEMHMAARPAASLISSLNTVRLSVGAQVMNLQIRALDEAGQAEATVILERRR